ncbi:MAG: hypothetical protein ABIJ92_02370 [Candidatus Aenigmatarchaeota archaeon]
MVDEEVNRELEEALKKAKKKGRKDSTELEDIKEAIMNTGDTIEKKEPKGSKKKKAKPAIEPQENIKEEENVISQEEFKDLEKEEKKKKFGLFSKKDEDVEQKKESPRSGNLDELLFKVEKLEGKLESLDSQRAAGDERLSRLAEEIGELRSALLERERTFNKIESGYSKMKDIIDEVKPEKVIKGLEQINEIILKDQAKLESLELKTNKITEDSKSLRDILAKIRSFENIISVFDEMQKKLNEIESDKKYMAREAGKVESMFSESNKTLKEFRKYKEQIELNKDMLNEIMKSVDLIEIKLDKTANKDDLTDIDDRLKNIHIAYDDKVQDMKDLMQKLVKTMKEKGFKDIEKGVVKINKDFASRKEIEDMTKRLDEIRKNMQDTRSRIQKVETAKSDKRLPEEYEQLLKNELENISKAKDELESRVEKTRNDLESRVKEIERYNNYPAVSGEIKNPGDFESIIGELIKRVQNLERIPSKSLSGATESKEILQIMNRLQNIENHLDNQVPTVTSSSSSRQEISQMKSDMILLRKKLRDIESYAPEPRLREPPRKEPRPGPLEKELPILPHIPELSPEHMEPKHLYAPPKKEVREIPQPEIGSIPPEELEIVPVIPDKPMTVSRTSPGPVIIGSSPLKPRRYIKTEHGQLGTLEEEFEDLIAHANDSLRQRDFEEARYLYERAVLIYSQLKISRPYQESIVYFDHIRNLYNRVFNVGMPEAGRRPPSTDDF